MKKLRALLISATLVLLTLPFATPTFAGEQRSADCAGGAPVRAILYENAIGDTSDGNDYYKMCDWSTDFEVNLDFLSHTLSGRCNGLGFTGDDWNDCISSIWVASNWRLCGYRNANGTTLIFGGLGDGTRDNLVYQDDATIVLLRPWTKGVCPSNLT